MQPNNSNHELIRKGLSLLTKGLRPFIEKEMRTVFGEDWEHEARSALRTPPGVLLHWDSQAVLNVIDRRWNDVFRRKLEKKHRSWAIEAVALRHDLMHEKKQMFSDKETMRGLDTVECLLAAVSAPESQEVALFKNAIGGKPPTPPSPRRQCRDQFMIGKEVVPTSPEYNSGNAWARIIAHARSKRGGAPANLRPAAVAIPQVHTAAGWIDVNE